MKDFFYRFFHNRLAVIGSILLLLLVTLAIFAPLIAPYDPLANDISAILSPPTAAHPFGTDNLGRDILSRIIFGARISLRVSIVSVAIATAAGVFLGVIAGFYGGDALAFNSFTEI